MESSNAKKLLWWQLSLIGVGCIMGTGFFLGSGIAMRKAGPAVLIAYVLASIGTWIVFDALAKMTENKMEKGSFRTYAKQAYGPWAGFSNGWMYLSAEVLITGSQLTALALFSQFWFPAVPLWIFAACFAGIGLIIVWMGVEKVEKMENAFGLMKVAAIVMFIIIAGAVLFGWFGFVAVSPQTPFKNPLPFGAIGVWTALIYAFYGFGGVEVMGLMARDLKNHNDISKSGKTMLLLLTTTYLLSFYLIIKLIPLENINVDESPFLTTLKQYDLPVVLHIINSILIIAGFSTMVASLYAVTTMIMTLAEEKDAPKMFAKKSKWKVPLPAFCFTTIVVAVSIVCALILPENLFEYITTAAGLMLLYIWMFILISYKKLIGKTKIDHMKVLLGLFLILCAVSGTIVDSMSRPGFFVSIGFIALIAIATFIFIKRRNSRT